MPFRDSKPKYCKELNANEQIKFFSYPFFLWMIFPPVSLRRRVILNQRSRILCGRNIQYKTLHKILGFVSALTHQPCLQLLVAGALFGLAAKATYLALLALKTDLQQ